MAKYFVFAGLDYYPSGGNEDFVRVIDAATDAEAIAALESDMPDGDEWVNLAKFEANNLSDVAWWKCLDRFGKPPVWHRHEI